MSRVSYVASMSFVEPFLRELDSLINCLSGVSLAREIFGNHEVFDRARVEHSPRSESAPELRRDCA